MIAALRGKLTLLLTGVLAAVILCTALAALLVSEGQMEDSEWVRLTAQMERVVQDVRLNSILKAPELAKIEASDNLIISIADSGGPIPFRGGWQSATDREILISRAIAAAEGAAGHWQGTVMGDHGERYLAAVSHINDYRSPRTVAVLRDMGEADAQRRVQRLRYGGIALSALAVIALFCWFFTGWAVQPIRDAHEKQNRFVSAASHELRTPLQVIRFNAEALKLAPPDPTPFIQQILKELTHMGRLSDDLLLLTAAPERTAGGSPVEAGALIRSAAECYAAAAAQKGVGLSAVRPKEALPLVEGNEAMLQRAVNILVDNAVCYTPAGGHVRIIAERKGREVVLSVEDDGPGIAPEHRKRIFERFYRTEKSRTDRLHSGLGLSVARSIAASHGGSVTYTPVEPHGSRFRIILPGVEGPIRAK